jgi:Bacterial PH domain
MDSVTLRPLFGRVLTVIVCVICGSALVTFVIVGDLAGLARYCWPLLLSGFLCWMLFWSPSVTVDPAGVVIRNLVRESRITWPAILRVDTKYALTIYTAAGKFTAWSAPAPSILQSTTATRLDLEHLPDTSYDARGGIRPGALPKSDSGQASLLVNIRLGELRAAGHLDNPVVEGTGVVTRWLWPNVIVSISLAIATFLANVL